MGMDHNMYQIYTIMTQRAVGICSALKQDQFRALTEITINRLMQATQSQTTVVHEALQNQRRIAEMGVQNIREYEANQEKIKESQMRALEELTKANEIMEELNANIQKEIEWKKKSEQQMYELDKATSEIGQNLELTNRQMIAHYQEALDFLDNFKSMMDLVATFSQNVQNTFEKFKAAMNEIGIDITAEFFVLLGVNASYFALGMLFIIFLELSTTFKNILIGLTIFNSLAAYFQADVPVAGINMFVWTFYFIFYRFLPILSQKLTRLVGMLPELRKFSGFMRMRKKSENNDSDYEDCNNNRRGRSLTPIQNKTPKTSHKTMDVVTEEDMEMEDIFSTPMMPMTPKPKRPETPIVPRAMSPVRLFLLIILNIYRFISILHTLDIKVSVLRHLFELNRI